MAVEAVLRCVVLYVASFPDGPQDSGHLRTSFNAEGGREPLRLRLGLCLQIKIRNGYKTACLENDYGMGFVPPLQDRTHDDNEDECNLMYRDLEPC